MGTTREDIINVSVCEKHWPEAVVNVGVVWSEAVWGKWWNSSSLSGLEMREYMKWCPVTSMTQGNCILLKLQRKRYNQITVMFC